ncbi:hypothetical protein LXL04_033636 [Taraxacum kok-saghyz]
MLSVSQNCRLSKHGSIKVHHSGKFTKFLNIHYIEGIFPYIDLVVIDEFFVHVMDDIMIKLGYEDSTPMYYNFLVPNEGYKWNMGVDETINIGNHDEEVIKDVEFIDNDTWDSLGEDSDNQM